MSQTSEQKLKAMFDEEVLQELRRQFDAADADGNGQLDMEEACELFAKSLADSCSGEEEVKRTAKRLLHDMDTDRSSSISFEEYCFRFGRKYQMEASRRRRQGLAMSGTSTSSSAPQTAAQIDEAEKLRVERERLEKEREALRQEREALERERSRSSTSGVAAGSSAGGEARREEESRRPPDASALVPGTRVQLVGLQGAAALNGKCGKVVRVDAASGRCVVDLDENAGQKSIRLENLSIVDAQPAATAMLKSAVNKAKHWLKVASAQVQVWMAGYEWWQLLLGLAVVVLIVSAYLQNSAKHSKPQPGQGLGASRGSEAGSWAEERRASEFDDPRYREPSSDRHWDRDGDSRGYRGSQDHGGYQSEFGNQRRHGRRGSFEAYDGDSGGYHSGGYSGGGGGLLSNLDPTSTMLVLGGLGYLCWKGIIPVHRMSFFQLYMLWGIVEPLLFGGGRRRRSMYPMGFGMPRFL